MLQGSGSDEDSVPGTQRAAESAHAISTHVLSGEDEGKWESGESERREGKDERQEQIQKEKEREKEESTVKGPYKVPLRAPPT